MVFSIASASGEWKWGEHMLSKVSNYAYLGANFASNGAWDSHVKDVCVLTVERSLISCIASLVIGILICVHVDCCYCLLFDLVLSMVVQFGIGIRIRLVL